jgi:cbb3-type cytochrome oxidase subunit 3
LLIENKLLRQGKAHCYYSSVAKHSPHNIKGVCMHVIRYLFLAVWAAGSLQASPLLIKQSRRIIAAYCQSPSTQTHRKGAAFSLFLQSRYPDVIAALTCYGISFAGLKPPWLVALYAMSCALEHGWQTPESLALVEAEVAHFVSVHQKKKRTRWLVLIAVFFLSCGGIWWWNGKKKKEVAQAAEAHRALQQQTHAQTEVSLQEKVHTVLNHPATHIAAAAVGGAAVHHMAQRACAAWKESQGGHAEEPEEPRSVEVRLAGASKLREAGMRLTFSERPYKQRYEKALALLEQAETNGTLAQVQHAASEVLAAVDEGARMQTTMDYAAVRAFRAAWGEIYQNSLFLFP